MPSQSTTTSFSDEELLALLRDESVSPQSIAAEMSEAGAPPYPLEALAAARTVLKSLQPGQVSAIEALPPPLRTFVLDVAIRERCVDLLQALAGSGDKSVVKDAKRALHALRTQGVKAEAPRAAAPAPVAAPPEEQPVFMSAVDGTGRRALFFIGPARGGMDVAQLLVSDTVGVVSAELAQLARKEYRRFIERLSSSDMLVAEVPRSYARSLVAKALDLNARARRAVPPTFNDVAFLLGPGVGAVVCPARAAPRPEDEVTARLRGAELLSLRDFLGWLPPEDVRSSFELRRDEIAVSKLYVDETQRGAALRELAASAAGSFWSQLQRALFAGRLFDMALLLSRLRREEHASLALATAWALESDVPLEGIPFAYALFERLLPMRPPAPEETAPRSAPTSPGSLILTP